MSAQQYRPIFLSVALLLTFMVFRGGQRRNRADHPEENPTAGDWALGIAAAVSVGYAGAPPTSCSAAPPRPRRSTS